MIWLLAHPLPFSHVSKLDLRHTGRLKKRDNLLTGEGREGVGEEPNHTTTRKPGSLYLIQYRLLAHPLSPLSSQHVISLFQSFSRRSGIRKGDGGGNGRGDESLDHEKAWSSKNHSILSDPGHKRPEINYSLCPVNM